MQYDLFETNYILRIVVAYFEYCIGYINSNIALYLVIFEKCQNATIYMVLIQRMQEAANAAFTNLVFNPGKQASLNYSHA